MSRAAAQHHDVEDRNPRFAEGRWLGVVLILAILELLIGAAILISARVCWSCL
ncbi:hypothetical protein [Pseudoroseicyclus aestuarii]|uniref:Uncharacterized protein n=1 Tax=Pseudoroseicyclus aestuarii TaxID=1795041 RepID=A0A318SMZ3_9RHOB|nr:hypothetical protein [Pseudoroseicyclus aestuarii]PYE80401.1 hypothetical protein DFP88_11611 [Pseudoroseicyclus aestuarii]